ncbi:MtrAB system histidine kinase MtrB [Subtercola lobariae]|uniref:Sensor histidine kinase MtrB n=1 Tax=Subtercola lobariae TaxID=1588641 RepID=A0A917EU89_9MICO|nr:MtrAB system histidine kinase MtrB [Subtercola lobariae]GGF14411.1 two-component sensor histidine kinase [Subtercola lobariae]
MATSSAAEGRSGRSHIGPFLAREWRAWPGQIAGWWRLSLQFRTIVITIGLTTVALLGAGIYTSVSIGNDLFHSRLNQTLLDANQAAKTAQTIFDASDSSTDSSVSTLLNSAQTKITSSSSSRLIAIYAAPGQDQTATSFLPFASPELVTPGIITDELRAEVTAGAGTQTQYWQSVSLPNDNGGFDPGIIVGSPLTIPSAGQYQLYLGYNLSDSAQTLSFVQQTLWIAGLLLTLLIALVAWVIVRLVIEPIRVAAETSEKLAAGELEVRIPEKGEDIIATLAHSFNGMADSMQGQITQLAELSQLQQRFVSDVSHELRTPLTTIRLAGDVLYDKRETFEPAIGRTAELLHTQTVRFELLLNDLLEISRFDAGSADLNIEPASLVRLAVDAIDQMRPLAEAAGSEVRIYAPGGHIEVEMDARRIRRIVTNLLGNAIEHGEGRPILVSVDSNVSAIAIAVRDYGIGMSQDDAERVFERFWRADPSRKRTIGGTGLGLAISLEDAALHGGQLEVWTHEGEGSCFRLTLPRVHGRQVGESPIALPPEDPDESDSLVRTDDTGAHLFTRSYDPTHTYDEPVEVPAEFPEAAELSEAAELPERGGA